MSHDDDGSRPPAVLFDVDGTLVDSNYLHVHAWRRAFTETGLPVESWRLHHSIGMDGTTLVRTLSDDAPDSVQHQLKDLHDQYYRETTHLLTLLPGARELLARVAGLGLQVVLATSAPEDELAILRGLLDSEDLISEVTSSEDVDTAKPEPDIVRVALDRAGVDAGRAVFVGDAVWDAEAARRAKVPSIGLRSGGVAQCELEKAGAAMVFDNPQHLLENLDSTRIAALAPRRSGAPR
jgi:HAD superfamily hydrolase (TIGR01509 family)